MYEEDSDASDKAMSTTAFHNLQNNSQLIGMENQQQQEDEMDEEEAEMLALQQQQALKQQLK